jgi:hypothetical protein
METQGGWGSVSLAGLKVQVVQTGRWIVLSHDFNVLNRRAADLLFYFSGKTLLGALYLNLTPRVLPV